MLPYDLKAGDVTSNRFYQILSKYCEELLYKIYPATNSVVEDFQRFLHQGKIEKVRYKQEYCVEYIMIGVLWNRYISVALNTSFITSQIGLGIKTYLQSHPDTDLSSQKFPLFDKFFLKAGNEEPEFSYVNFLRLIDWMTITGHFTEEVKRLANWEKYLSNFSETEVSDFLSKISRYANWVESINYSFFHEFTKGIFAYLQTDVNDKYGSADIILHEKMPEEYHFSILAIQTYNLLWKQEFSATAHKIVLLPNCMIPINENCKYYEQHGYRFCSACNCFGCNIGRVKNMLGSTSEVMIVQHEFGFDFLKDWPDKENYGFIVIACVATLLNSCLQMRGMGFKIQSVYLDNCGCFTHWTNKGEETITGINMKHLLEILIK